MKTNHLKQPYNGIRTIFAVLITLLLLNHEVRAEDSHPLYLPLIFQQEPCFSSENPLVNGDFELGDESWTFSSAYVSPGPVGKFTPHGGGKMVVLQTIGLPGIPMGYIEQRVNVPACFPYLSLWYGHEIQCKYGDDYPCTSGLGVQVDGEWLSDQSSTSGNFQPWTHLVINLSAYQGKTIILRLSAASVYTTTGYLDDITFQSYPLP